MLSTLTGVSADRSGTFCWRPRMWLLSIEDLSLTPGHQLMKTHQKHSQTLFHVLGWSPDWVGIHKKSFRVEGAAHHLPSALSPACQASLITHSDLVRPLHPERGSPPNHTVTTSYWWLSVTLLIRPSSPLLAPSFSPSAWQGQPSAREDAAEGIFESQLLLQSFHLELYLAKAGCRAPEPSGGIEQSRMERWDTLGLKWNAPSGRLKMASHIILLIPRPQKESKLVGKWHQRYERVSVVEAKLEQDDEMKKPCSCSSIEPQTENPKTKKRKSP